MNGHIVRIRFGNEEHRVTEFVTPHHHQVQWLAKQLKYDVQSCYNWVTVNVNYPRSSDRHSLQAFGGIIPFGPKLSFSAREFWQFPAETLGWMNQDGAIEDCDGSSILLCSMLRCFVPEDSVYVAVGGHHGIDHAWVRYQEGGRWYVLESTLDKPFPLHSLPEDSFGNTPGPYNLYAYFNDKESVEVIPGSFTKLNARKKDYTSLVNSLKKLRVVANLSQSWEKSFSKR